MLLPETYPNEATLIAPMLSQGELHPHPRTTCPSCAPLAPQEEHCPMRAPPQRQAKAKQGISNAYSELLSKGVEAVNERIAHIDKQHAAEEYNYVLRGPGGADTVPLWLHQKLIPGKLSERLR